MDDLQQLLDDTAARLGIVGASMAIPPADLAAYRSRAWAVAFAGPADEPARFFLNGVFLSRRTP